MASRDRERGGRLSGILDEFGSEDEEDRGKRRGQLGLRESAAGEGEPDDDDDEDDGDLQPQVISAPSELRNEEHEAIAWMMHLSYRANVERVLDGGERGEPILAEGPRSTIRSWIFSYPKAN